jgi:hypothetical protein
MTGPRDRGESHRSSRTSEAGPAEQLDLEEDRLALDGMAGRPTHAVLAVELGGQCPAGEGAVESLLAQPHRELAVSIEAQPKPGVTEDVVHGPEAVKGPARLVAHQRMATIAVRGDRGDLEHPIHAYRVDELVGIVKGAGQAVKATRTESGSAVEVIRRKSRSDSVARSA